MKKLIYLLIAVLVIGISVSLYYYMTTPDTSLSEEKIAHYHPGMKYEKVKDEFKVDKYVQLEGKQFYHSKKYKGLTVRESKKTKKISAIILFTNKDVSTSRGIKLGDSKEDVIKAYGDTYKKSISPKHQTSFQYRDKENKLGMSFYFKENKLERIELFDS